MTKLTNVVPKYRRHKRSGQAVVTLNGWKAAKSRQKVAAWRHRLATN